MGRIAVIGLLVLLVVVGGSAGAIYLVDWHSLIEDRASAAMGRTVEMDEFAIEPGRVTRVRLDGVRIANPEWAATEHLATVEAATIGLRVWTLLQRPLEFTEILLETPAIALERDSDGKVNWSDASAAGDAASPDEREDFPVIQTIVIRDGQIRYSDAVRQLTLEGTVATAKGDSGDGDGIDLALDGSLEGKSLLLKFSGGSAALLVRTEKPYPLEIDVEHGETSIRAEGTLTTAGDAADFDFEFAISGPSLAESFPIFQIPLPETAAYSLAGQLSRDGRQWRLTNFAGSVGESDLSGSLALDYGRDPPFLEATMQSDKVALTDLSGLIGADPRTLKTPREQGELFPDYPVATARLHTMNMDVRYRAQHVVSRKVPIQALSFRVQIENGRAVADPLRLDVAGGRAFGEAAVNARSDPPAVNLDMRFESISLKPFFEGSDFVQEMGGEFFGSVDVSGVGRTLDRAMATLNGGGVVAMQDGTLSALLVEAAGLDLTEALSLVVGDDNTRVALRCGAVTFAAKDGKLRLEEARVDTSDSLLVAGGQVDLASETVNIKVEAREKDFSLIDASAPVAITGPLVDPEVSIGELESIPLFELGDQEDINCQALLDRALSSRASAEQPEN